MKTSWVVTRIVGCLSHALPCSLPEQWTQLPLIAGSSSSTWPYASGKVAQPQPLGVNRDQSSHGTVIKSCQVKQLYKEVCKEKMKTESLDLQSNA